MKKRTTQSTTGRSPEFKGVVKKITGNVTNRPDIEEEGRTEMQGGKTTSGTRKPRASLHSDPHRRG